MTRGHGARWTDCVNALMTHPTSPQAVLLIKLNLRLPEPDRVRRRHRNRSVDAEDRNLELLAGADLGAEHDAIGHVVALHGGRAWIAAAPWDLAVDPDLRIVIDQHIQ